MGMPVAQLLKQVSGRELAEWEAFERLYGPIDVGRRLDRAAALIAKQIANSSLAPQSTPYEIEDFLPRWDARPIDDGGGGAGGGGAA